MSLIRLQSLILIAKMRKTLQHKKLTCSTYTTAGILDVLDSVPVFLLIESWTYSIFLD